jgi:hypothetical protein
MLSHASTTGARRTFSAADRLERLVVVEPLVPSPSSVRSGGVVYNAQFEQHIQVLEAGMRGIGQHMAQFLNAEEDE